jgi:hypothetical protein
MDTLWWVVLVVVLIVVVAGFAYQRSRQTGSGQVQDRRISVQQQRQPLQTLDGRPMVTWDMSTEDRAGETAGLERQREREESSLSAQDQD